MGRFLAACAGLALLAMTGCASPPRAERHVALPPGSEYTQQVRYTGSYSGPAEIKSKLVPVTWNGEPYLGSQSAAGTLVMAPSGDWVVQLAPDGKPAVSWDPPIGFNWPLEVGKTWERPFKFTNHATKQVTELVSRAKVEAYEDVAVPAGTFKAFRVQVSNSVGLEETFWYSPDAHMIVKAVQTRTAAAAAGPGTREVELKTLSVAR